MNKVVKLIWNVVVWTLIFAILIIAAVATAPNLFGMLTLPVSDPSMSYLNPESEIKAEDIEGHMGHIPEGALIYVDKGDISEVEPYDVIVKNTRSGFEVRRVTKVEYDALDEVALKLQSDAEASVNRGYQQAEGYVGKVVFYVPYLGRMVEYVKEPPGLYLFVAGLLFLFLLIFVPNLINSFLKPNGIEEDDPTAEGETLGATAPETQGDEP